MVRKILGDDMREDIKELIKIIRANNIPDGFKRTECGIVSGEFEELVISEAGEFKNGINFSKEKGNNNVKFLGVGDFGDKTILESADELEKICVSISDDKLEPYFLKNDDIVFVRSNGSKELVGRNLLIQNLSEKVVYSGFCIRYRFNSNYKKVSMQYINAWLDNGVLKTLLKRENRGTNINNLNQEILSKLRIYVPEMEERKKILDIIDGYNTIISNMKQCIDYKYRQKKWLVQNLLTGKKRFLGFNGEWKKVKLSQILMKQNEKKGTSDMQICSVAVKKGIINQIEHMGRTYAANDTSHYNVVQYGDIVYTKSPTGDFPYGIIKQSFIEEKVAVSPLYGVFKASNFALGYLLHTYFQDKRNVFNYLHPLVQKGAKNTINITNDDFLKNTLLLPMDNETQKRLVNVFMIADKEIELLEQKLELIKQEKKAIMQLLLTGIVRVSET